MLAGFSETIITPEVGGLMPGEFEAYKTTLPARVQLCCNAAAFTSGEQSVILVSMDVISSSVAYVDQIRSRISAATGVPVKNILVAATHTHTGPALEYDVWCVPADPVQSAFTADQAVQAAVEAWENRTEAAIGVGKCFENRFSYCRDFYLDDGSIRMNPSSSIYHRLVRPVREQIDHSLNAMRVDDAKGNTLAFLVNFANHADSTGGAPRNMYSPDYPGYIRAALQGQYGKQVRVLFFNGACGDVNHIDYLHGNHRWYYAKGISAAEIIGCNLALDVINMNPAINTEGGDMTVDAVSNEIVTSRRHLTEADMEWAKQVMENPEKYNSGDRAFAGEYLLGDDPSDEISIEVHTMRLGPWAIVGLPSEIFSEIGLAIKERSPFEHTLVFELANGHHGYIPPAYVIGSGAYEARVSKLNSACGPETAELLIEQSIRQLNALAAKEQK